MNEISESYQNLPDTIEDLSQFVLVSEVRLKAAREQIRTIRRVNVAKEVYEQKLAEAQEIGQVAVEAAQKMGELLLQIQKRSGNQYTSATSTDIEKAKTKTEITSEMGMSKDQVSQYQQMAQNPDAVQAAIQKAIENGDVVSRSSVMKEIRAAKMEMAEQIAEKDRRIKELENRPPDVKEVVPDDYESLKRQLRSTEERFEDMRSKYFSEKERTEQLESKIGSDEKLRKANLTINHFTVATNNYIQQYGGHVWAFGEIDKVDDATRVDFIRAIKSLDGFAQQLLKNIGGIADGQ